MIEPGSKIRINQECLKLDWINSKAMILGYNGGKIKQSIYCLTGDQSFPNLITYQKSRSRFSKLTSSKGKELNSRLNLPSLQYIAVLEKKYQINNNQNLWKLICNNTLFDIWNWEAPFNLFNEKELKIGSIALLRIYKIEENFKNKFHPKNNYIDFINDGVDLNVTIEAPVISDNDFNKLKELLEESIEPYLFDKRSNTIIKPNNHIISKPEIKEKEPQVFLYQEYLERSNLNEGVFQKYLQLIERKKQVIFQGAPGTGKSYLAQIFINLITEEGPNMTKSSRYRVVQFHPSYSYEDFIQG